jgi:hypothetical protein
MSTQHTDRDTTTWYFIAGIGVFFVTFGAAVFASALLQFGALCAGTGLAFAALSRASPPWFRVSPPVVRVVSILLALIVLILSNVFFVTEALPLIR